MTPQHAVTALCFTTLCSATTMLAGELPPKPFHFRLAVSQRIIGADVNESDASLAMHAWRDALSKNTDFVFDFDVTPMPRILRELRDRQLDGFSMTILEFLEVESFASQSLVMDDANARGGDEYLLLVHEDSGIKILADLRRKSVNVFDNPKMCLAAMWLETAFLSANLGAPQEFVGRIALQNKLSRAVLPVYFRQSDACVVTRRGFATMCELNPQLGRKLHVLASSPNLITGLMAFHKDFAFERRQKLQAALVGLNKTTAGQQALTLFESGPLVVVDASVLRTTLDLVKTHEQLLRKAVPARK